MVCLVVVVAAVVVVVVVAVVAVVVVVVVVAVVVVVVVVGITACTNLWVLAFFQCVLKQKVHLAYTRCSFIRNMRFA